MRAKDLINEGWARLPDMDKEKYQPRDGLEGPIMTRSGKVVYYDNVEGKYYDPDTDMYLTYDEWKAFDPELPIKNEYVQDGPEQGFGGQERNFIQDLCMMYDGVKRDPAGLKYLGTSELWDEGNILKDKGKLTTLMLWTKKNKDDVAKRFSRHFNTYSNKGEASDGNQILNNIIKKIGSITEDDFDAKGLEGKALMQLYKDNEHNNQHSENNLLLAKAFGTPKEIKMVELVLAKNKKQGYTDTMDSEWMYHNINKRYYPQLVKGALGESYGIIVGMDSEDKDEQDNKTKAQVKNKKPYAKTESIFDE